MFGGPGGRFNSAAEAGSSSIHVYSLFEAVRVSLEGMDMMKELGSSLWKV